MAFRLSAVLRLSASSFSASLSARLSEIEFFQPKSLFHIFILFIESIFFEDDFSVESYVSNGKRTKDLFYKNGILIRRKVYE